VPTISVTNLAGNNLPIVASNGLSVMEAIRDAGIDDIQALCGGCCSCATCHVYVAEAWLQKLPQPSRDEQDLLESSAHYQPNSRLSCQLEVCDELDGMQLQVAAEG